MALGAMLVDLAEEPEDARRERQALWRSNQISPQPWQRSRVTERP
jgi:hypothetical protein